MFYSQRLLSSKGPLGSVWVAAYCHKRLKKEQVSQTDIPFSVDKILLEGVPIITYRILGYLLLGVVRIYSKKVEYLFDDCYEVLMNINKVSVGKRVDAPGVSFRAPYYSITLPERFELDAFEFEVMEDVSGGNMLPREEITLKDKWKDVGIRNYSLDEFLFEASSFDLETCSNMDAATDYFPLPHPMDVYTVASPLHKQRKSVASIETLGDDTFCQVNDLEFEMVIAPTEEESLSIVGKNGIEHQTEEPKMQSQEETECQVKAGNHQQSNSAASMEKVHVLCQEECQEHEMLGESPNFVRPSGEENDTNLEKTEETTSHQTVREDLPLSIASTKKLHGNVLCQEEYQELEMLGESPDFVRPSGEENDANLEKTKLPEGTTSAHRKHQTVREDLPLSIAVNSTPGSKFPDPTGATTPESMGIITPANKERARTPRKRKCLVDNEVVLSNKVLRESIHDSSGLVCQRRKAPHTILGVWKASRIPNLSQGFSEPLIPCSFLELRSLFDNKKLKPEGPAGNIEALKKLELPESPTVGMSTKQTAFAPETPVQRSANETCEKSFDKFDPPGSATVSRSPQQTAVDPETPNQHSTSMGFFGDPDITIAARVPPGNLFESVEKEPSLHENQEFDLGLMNEEIILSEGDSQEPNGWSGRTRTAARFLQISFANQKKQKEEEAVNLMQVLRWRTKKESARLFYEILVLKTKGCADVKQDAAYADVLVTKSSRWEQLCGVDAL